MEKRQKLIDVWVASDGSEHINAFKCEEHERRLAEEKTQNFVQRMNQEAILANQARVQAVRDRWATHPEEQQAFIEMIRARHQETIELGVKLGWWERAGLNGDPIAPAIEVRIQDLEPHETLMAHIVAKHGFFKSVSDARKNGWDKPVETGEFWFRKKTVCLRVVD